MNKSNLIPAARLASKGRRRAMRRWSIICIAYASMFVVASIGAYAFWGVASFDGSQMTKVKNETAHVSAMLASIRSKSTESRRVLDSLNEVSDQPDWSILLSTIAKKRGNDVFITSCELAAPTDAGKETSFKLMGVARSQEAIGTFVLQLQNLPLFDHVKLMQTNRQEVLGVEGVAFGLNCTIRAAGN